MRWDWASREHQKMFPADKADFYRIFLHIKQIIRPSESQPCIKNNKEVLILTIVLILCSKSIDCLYIKFFLCLPSLSSTCNSDTFYELTCGTNVLLQLKVRCICLAPKKNTQNWNFPSTLSTNKACLSAAHQKLKLSIHTEHKWAFPQGKLTLMDRQPVDQVEQHIEASQGCFPQFRIPSTLAHHAATAQFGLGSCSSVFLA